MKQSKRNYQDETTNKPSSSEDVKESVRQTQTKKKVIREQSSSTSTTSQGAIERNVRDQQGRTAANPIVIE